MELQSDELVARGQMLDTGVSLEQQVAALRDENLALKGTEINLMKVNAHLKREHVLCVARLEAEKSGSMIEFHEKVQLVEAELATSMMEVWATHEKLEKLSVEQDGRNAQLTSELGVARSQLEDKNAALAASQAEQVLAAANSAKELGALSERCTDLSTLELTLTAQHEVEAASLEAKLSSAMSVQCQTEATLESTHAELAARNLRG
jgi:hypothetical protein